VIEDMEESILCFGDTGKFLNIINDQYIDCLVEVDKIIRCIIAHRIGVLYLK